MAKIQGEVKFIDGEGEDGRPNGALDPSCSLD